MVDKPYKVEMLGETLSEDERKLMHLSLECEFCENDTCRKSCPKGIDIRGINRRTVVGNTFGAKKFLSELSGKSPCDACSKICENNCNRASKSQNAVKISEIVTKVFEI